jgi:N-acetylmuramic acid 6-phosphate etherase
MFFMSNNHSISLGGLTTESRNQASLKLDQLSSLEIVQLINAEDARVAEAVGLVAEPIAKAIDVIAERLSNGGRLIYVGAGTSGRLGVLDAVECPPTFNTDPAKVVGVMAGGPAGLLLAVEGAEDSAEQGAKDLQELTLSSADVVVGIAASGRTPYVIGALDYARSLGAYAIGFSCNKGSEMERHTDLDVVPVVGPEVLTGSTRMKAGTATKMVLNMLTTGAMVLMGKTYSNLMVDVRATNVKLLERSTRIVAELAQCDIQTAGNMLTACDGELKTAVVALSHGVSAPVARQRLEQVDGHLREALSLDGIDQA